MKCPKCGCTNVAAEVRTWFDFTDDKPEEFDTEDSAYVELIPGGDIICKQCQHQWSEPTADSKLHTAAPELLDALNALLGALHVGHYVMQSTPAARALIEQARAAVIKATA